jgi:transposase
MNTREQRGIAIAATQKLTRSGDSWLVPSQSAPRKNYVVRPNPERPYCSCPDHDALGIKCKHIFAVEFVIQRELFPDGEAQVTQTVTVTEKVKKTYKQDWPAYNAAQTNEKDKFLMLLHDLCKGIKDPPANKTGRPRIPLADAIFAACFKVYSTFSGRRFMSDLRDAHAKGYIRKAPHFNTIFNTLEDPEVFEVLRALVVETSLPLKAVETEFAIDSTGFSGCRFIRWHEVKHEGRPALTDYVKAHLCCGVKTNIVTSVEIQGKSQDSPMLKPLLLKTAENFKIDEVSGDKAYASKNNYEMVNDLGGTGYFAFKDSTTGGIGGLWAKMFHYFCYRQAEFLAHYHKRSNIESTNMMIKTKFRDNVRSKTEVAANNEVLCKIVCHNIVVLIHEMYELGIEPEFYAAQKLPSASTDCTKTPAI